MSRKIPASIGVAAFLFFAFPVSAQHGGMGHAFGAHSGFNGGHSFGHSVGHSLGNFFGHRSGRARGLSPGKTGAEAPPLAGAAMIHGRIVQLPSPQGVLFTGRNRFHRPPVTEFAFPPRFGRFAAGNQSFFNFCGASPGFFGARRLFRGDFDCFQARFLFDPFFLIGFDPFALGDRDAGAAFTAAELAAASDERQMASQEAGDEPPQAESPARPPEQAPPPPETLLQLRNGEMYGLTSYWSEGDHLHYITNYGGENSVLLGQIDFDETVRLNAERGIKFEIRPKISPEKP